MTSEIVTYTGRVIDPLDPDPRRIVIEDIAHSLANQCRFTGHTRKFYSVAEHSVLGAEWMGLCGCSRDSRIAFLLHDASEAYIADIARPIKNALSGLGDVYREIESVLTGAVFAAFGLDLPWPDEVDEYDDAMLMTEQRVMMPPVPRLQFKSERTDMSYPFDIPCWDPDTAEVMFLAAWGAAQKR